MSEFNKALKMQSDLYKAATAVNRFAAPLTTYSLIQAAIKRPVSFNWSLKAEILTAYSDPKISVLNSLQQIHHLFTKNPELEFISVSDLELLSLKSSEEFINVIENDEEDETLSYKETLLEDVLTPYLDALEISSLWHGANSALKAADNPDRLRQTLVSLRSLLECLIDYVLAPNSELMNSNMFTKEFKKYHEGKKTLSEVKITRKRKLSFIGSKFEFKLLDGLTEKDLNFIDRIYETLCNLHQPDIGLSENQVRALKVKTGITIWLLAYIDERSRAAANTA